MDLSKIRVHWSLDMSLKGSELFILYGTHLKTGFSNSRSPQSLGPNCQWLTLASSHSHFDSYSMSHTVRWSIWVSVSRSPKSFELWKKISKSFEGIMFVSFFPFANMPFLSTQQNRFESTSIYQSKFHFWKQALEVIIRC